MLAPCFPLTTPRSPKVKTHGAMQPGLPYEIAPSGALSAGVPSTIQLIGFGPDGDDFKGWLVTPDQGVLSNPSAGSEYVDKKLGPCGFGHNESSVRTSVSFTFTPDKAGPVHFAGFVLKDMDHWFALDSTIPVL